MCQLHPSINNLRGLVARLLRQPQAVAPGATVCGDPGRLSISGSAQPHFQRLIVAFIRPTTGDPAEVKMSSRHVHETRSILPFRIATRAYHFLSYADGPTPVSIPVG